ncbi:hypothetical protein M758_4G150400 [Ceratodon purpureus]|nr:hypothetical protein M758_4G150400 [Ceratodon purpureus]
MSPGCHVEWQLPAAPSLTSSLGTCPRGRGAPGRGGRELLEVAARNATDPEPAVSAKGNSQCRIVRIGVLVLEEHGGAHCIIKMPGRGCYPLK